MHKLSERIYDPKVQELAVFRKTHEKWGAFSNMAAGFPICINNHKILSSEALYQALKFTQHPEIQEIIISQKSPMTAKMVSKPYKKLIRQDWESRKIVFMKWCVRAKLICNYEKFSKILLDSNNLLIIEESKKDNFWGAKPIEGKLIGANVLGRILIELRDQLKNGYNPETLPPLLFDNFSFLGEKISVIEKTNSIPYLSANKNLDLFSLD